MRRHLSLPDLQQARTEAEVRARQCRLYQHQLQLQPTSSSVTIPDLVLLHHLLPAPVRNSQDQPCPPQKERKGIFLKKGKKSAALGRDRDFSNKYEKRKSVQRFLMKNQMKISAPQMNLLSMSRLSKSETSLLKPTDMFMWR